MSKQLELCAWLGEATRGLPDRIKAVVYDELTAHYEDALAEAQLHGAGMAEAHQSALAQLGDARVTCRALRDTHLAHRRYSLAAAVSLFSLVMLLLGAFFTTILPLLFFILSIICTIYLLRSLKRLIEPILPIPRLRYSIALVEVCLLIAGIFSLVAGLDARTYPIVMVFNDPFILGTPGLVMQQLSGLHILLAVSVAGVGLGWILLGEQLFEHDAALYRLGGLLRFCLFAVGLGLLGAGIALLLRNSLALNTLTLLIIICGTARQALFALLFFRAASPQYDRRAHA